MAAPHNTIPKSLVGTARELARGGDAVVDTAHGVVFVRGLFPGESAELVDARREKGALRARVSLITTASKERVVAACAFVETCGGCPSLF